ncbi:MAG: TRAP transporter small permease subunit [Myxococcales bacterium]|nr:TRAP transporter small permease subunit [Myxococcales bacterium]
MESPPAGEVPRKKWVEPFVKVDALWTKVEMYLVLALLIAAILYMSGWVTLNAFHTKGGKLARFPGIIATFAGAVTLVTWVRAKPRKVANLVVSIVLLVFGAILLSVSKKADYFANVARWLADASVIKQVGTPQIVSARMFTIWIALVGASLATGAGRQINIDVVMRFIGPRPRLFVAIFSYVATAFTCFVISWGFLDYLAITRFGAGKEQTKTEKAKIIGEAIQRHGFLLRRQLSMDVRSFGKVVLSGQPFDKWYTGTEWNKEINENGWAKMYPPKGAVPAYKPCLSPQELEQLTAQNTQFVEGWRLQGVCDIGDGNGTRAPLMTAPEPDDRTPLEADLSLLFPWGFFVIGLRFLLRGLLAIGGAVSTDPNAAHGADGPGHGEDPGPDDGPPAEPSNGVAHEAVSAAQPPEKAPPEKAPPEKAPAEKAPVEKAVLPSEAPTVAATPAASVLGPDDPTREEPRKARTSSRPPAEGVPTAQRLEAAQQAAAQEEEERTLVGDLSELARAQELREEQERKKAEKKGGDK